jgi:hypothetical protein
MFVSMALAVCLVPGEAPTKATLPDEWYGRWTGTVKATSVDGKDSEFAMDLDIQPLKDSKGYQWKIVYGEGKKRQDRNYELIPQEKANHFVIDEKNGLFIDAFLIGRTMHSHFQIGESLVPVRYERKGDLLIFSVTVYSTKDPRTTKLTKGEMEAKAHKLVTVQTAELRKAKGE